MKRKKVYILGKYSPYLTENMVMVLIFLIIVVVALSSFIKVHALERASNEQLMANITAQNLIEYCKATQIRHEDLLMNLGAKKFHGKYYFYYDSDWKEIEQKEQGSYITEVVIEEEKFASGVLKDIQVNVYRVQLSDREMIYSLSAKAY